MQVRLGSRAVGDGCPTFIVAEIGQNHQGDVYTALRLAGEAVKAGADAIKLQLRDAENEFPEEVLDAPHPLPQHAFGTTYREHRKVLDLTVDEIGHIKDRIAYNKWPVEFFVTPCAATCVPPLEQMGVSFYKVASKDLENDLLWDVIAVTGKPVICSSSRLVPWRAADVMQYCVSEYPTPLDHIDLSMIGKYRDQLYIAGYSDHSGSEIPGIAAVGLGAATVEVHVTMSKKLKGRDHAASLEIPQFSRLVKAIREIDEIRNRHSGGSRFVGGRGRGVVDLPASGTY